MTRPTWEEYFMEIARQVATRAVCMRRHVGAVIVRDRQILATGYNGPPSGVAHCDQVGCIREELGIPSGQRQEICRGLHAEQNAIIQAALHGVSTAGATIYVTHQPCVTCAKMIINAGIVEAVCENGYPDEMARDMLDEAHVALSVWDSKNESGNSCS